MVSYIWKAVMAYVKAFWEDFRVQVLHKEKKGHDDIWHKMTKYLILIPFDIIFAVLGIITLVACILLIVPIAKLFGYDLGGLFAEKQANLQAKLKPAMWIPGISSMHSARQKWNSVNPAEQVYKETLAAVKKMASRKDKGDGKDVEVIQVVESNQKDMRIKVHCFSKMKWLDVLELKVDVGEDMGGAVVDAFSYSTGCAPLILPPPVGVFTSATLFWVPFSDWGKNKERLEQIRGMLSVEIAKEK